MSISQLNKIRKRAVMQPKRDTVEFPRFMLQYGNSYNNRSVFKPARPSLRLFSQTPYVARAITVIKNPIISLEWEITTMDNVKMNSTLQKQADVVKNCFEHPNNDDSFRSLVEKIIEDYLVIGAGVIEQQRGAEDIRPLWMYPVDAQSIQIFAGWKGKPTEARYQQTIGYGNVGLDDGRLLRNDEIIYMIRRPTTATPFGTSSVEEAYDAVQRSLSAATYAGNVAGNAQPQNMLYLGNITAEEREAFDEYWYQYVEGRGVVPKLGGEIKPEVLKLNSGNDDALFLKWQEFLIRTIAAAFGISPQKLCLERDVNRNTAEVASDEDWDITIAPTARLIASYLTREAIHNKLGFYQLQFKFKGLAKDDELNTAQIYKVEYESNATTPNEYRARQGKPPINSIWGDMVAADVQVAMNAARGAKQVDDPNLKSNPGAQSNTDPTNAKLAQLQPAAPTANTTKE